MKKELQRIKYDVNITKVRLERQGEWGFDFDATHTIYSGELLTKEQLDEKVQELEVEIYADTPNPYEDGYEVEEYEYCLTIEKATVEQFREWCESKDIKYYNAKSLELFRKEGNWKWD